MPPGRDEKMPLRMLLLYCAAIPIACCLGVLNYLWCHDRDRDRDRDREREDANSEGGHAEIDDDDDAAAAAAR
jgi:predicted outer membrane lipoprotein